MTWVFESDASISRRRRDLPCWRWRLWWPTSFCPDASRRCARVGGMVSGVAETVASVVNMLLAVVVGYPLLIFWVMPKSGGSADAAKVGMTFPGLCPTSASQAPWHAFRVAPTRLDQLESEPARAGPSPEALRGRSDANILVSGHEARFTWYWRQPKGTDGCVRDHYPVVFTLSDAARKRTEATGRCKGCRKRARA